MNIEEDLKSLDVLHISILFWLMRGLSKEQIGRIFGNGEDWTKTRMTEIYDALGFDKNMHSHEKRRILESDYLPVVKLLTNDDDNTLKDWPLKAKKIDKIPNRGKDGGLPPVDQDRRSKTRPVDQDRRPESHPIDQPGKRNWLLFVPAVLIICILFVGALYMAFLFGKGNLTIPGIDSLPSATTAPSQIIPSKEVPIPSSTLPIPSPEVPALIPSDTPAPTDTETPIPPTPEFYEAGKWIPLNDTIYVRLNDEFYSMPDCRPKPDEFAVEIQFHDDNRNYLLRYDPQSFHAVDDTGKDYKLLGVGNIFCNEIGIQNKKITSNDTHLTVLFGGSFPLETKYVIITADSINGVKLVFHKSL